MKRMGVAKGFPDIFIAVAAGGFHGCFLELKRIKGGVISPEQQNWVDYLNKAGYKAAICRGFEEAKACVLEYLATEPPKVS